MTDHIHTYGFPDGYSQAEYDRNAFALRLSPDRGCPPRFDLFKRCAESLIPGHFEYHQWTNKLLDTVCNRMLVGIPGAAGTGKTFNISNFAAVWWLCLPHESSVILVSTSRESLRKRAWAELSRCFADAPEDIRGTFTDSRMIWYADYGDSRHAIFGKAVEEGSITKVADDIKGIHTRRQMVIIDEATAVPEAIFDACSNLFSYPEEFIMVVIGNPRNRLDQFSKFIEPAEGWSTVTVEDEEWEGKPQHDYGGNVPLVIRFDAEKSPNITEGRIVSRHLPLPHVVEQRKKAAGGQTPLWWSNFRGFPPPEGICKTVFSESAIAAQSAFDPFSFSGEAFQIVGGFDHARNGGDRPALRFAKVGMLTGGKLGIEWMPPIILTLNAASTVPIDFQLAEQVRLHCEHFVFKDVDYFCPFENLGVDATGEGSGFADILQRTVSSKIMRVVFSAAASDDAASLEDIRPACEVYENKRVEMFFRARDFLNHGQLRGVDRPTAIELCTLEFDDSGRRIKLQSKKEYKKMFRKSPDLADCFCAGTLVNTPRGRVPIERLTIGDTVSTPFGSTDIVFIHKERVRDITRVQFSNGASLSGKGKHRVFTSDSGWVRMDGLVLTNTASSDIDSPLWTFLNSLFTRAENTVFKLAVDIIKTKTGAAKRRDFFIESSGLSTMGLFLKACACIIRTAIGPTITKATSNYRVEKNTVKCTWSSVSKIQSFVQEMQSVSRRLLMRLGLGTAQLQASNGIGSMGSKTGSSTPKANVSAWCAKASSSATIHTRVNSAPTNAGRNRGVSFISLIRSALSAARCIAVRSILRRRVAPVHVESSSGPEQWVYNLTLRAENVFYANGILVENCAVLCCEVARIKGLRLVPQGETVFKYQDFEAMAVACQSVFANADYSPEELD